MNESTKTGAFWGLAVVLVIIAVLMARPQTVQDVNTNTLIGETLFKDFNDATKAAKLKIVKFNEEQGSLSSFEVAKNRETGDWTIPSATNYPADAADQMRKAGTVFLDTEILDVVSDAREKHKDFGVLEPDGEKLEVGDEGVGMLVELQDEEGTKLVDLIVGDKVPDSENERYVRKPNQDVVYRVKLDTSPLSTEFTDWIEKDLLKINTLDINTVSLRDYAIVRDLQGAQLTRNFEADLQSEEGGKWKLAKLVTYGENGQPQESTEIPSGKELDATKLNELKNALDNLKIVSVRRKPAGLGADLKVSSTDTAALSSLQSRGFYISKGEVYSANGEVLVTQKNGVQYLLRFGEIAGVGDEGDDTSKAKEADAAADAANKDKDPAGLNRYLLITAKLDESSIPPAELAEVPQTLEDWERIQAAQKKAEDEKANAGGPPAGADPNLPPLKPDDALRIPRRRRHSLRARHLLIPRNRQNQAQSQRLRPPNQRRLQTHLRRQNRPQRTLQRPETRLRPLKALVVVREKVAELVLKLSRNNRRRAVMHRLNRRNLPKATSQPKRLQLPVKRSLRMLNPSQTQS